MNNDETNDYKQFLSYFSIVLKCWSVMFIILSVRSLVKGDFHMAKTGFVLTLLMVVPFVAGECK